MQWWQLFQQSVLHSVGQQDRSCTHYVPFPPSPRPSLQHHALFCELYLAAVKVCDTTHIYNLPVLTTEGTQNRQCTYNIIRRVRVTTVAVKKQ